MLSVYKLQLRLHTPYTTAVDLKVPTFTVSEIIPVNNFPEHHITLRNHALSGCYVLSTRT